MRQALMLLVLIVLSAVLSAAEDKFATIRQDLARPGCRMVSFVNVVHSDIFDVVDSTLGKAYMASDGRYNVTIGGDTYLYDGDKLYSYSAGANQVIIEQVDPETNVGEEVTFITRLDQLFDSYEIEADRTYRLIKKGDNNGDYPDTMIVRIDSSAGSIEQIEYYDVNEELNRIIFLENLFDRQCDEQRFVPEFPDSVERVRL